MTRKNSLQDSLKASMPIFEFWNFLFQIIRSNKILTFPFSRIEGSDIDLSSVLLDISILLSLDFKIS